MNFIFDYIYYRLTKFYFKWDGRTGVTAIIAITMIQLLIVLDFIVGIIRFFYSRDETKLYVLEFKGLAIIFYIMLLIFNYKKYNGSYNKFKNYWKDESKTKKIYRGFFVILSLIIPWIPLILLAIYG